MSGIAAQAGSAHYSTLASDPDLAELVELFVAEMPERLAKLLADFEQGNWELLGRTAHQLKGAAGSYGFHQLTPLAAELEQAVRGGASIEQVQESLDQLSGMCRCLRAGLPTKPAGD